MEIRISQATLKRLILVTVALILLGVGIEWYSASRTDLDWMVVSYRYSEWHRAQETWEFNPNWIVPWHQAYLYVVYRMVAGIVLICIGTAILAVLAVKERIN